MTNENPCDTCEDELKACDEWPCDECMHVYEDMYKKKQPKKEPKK